MEKLLTALSFFKEFTPQEKYKYLKLKNLLSETSIEWHGRVNIPAVKLRKFKQFYKNFSIASVKAELEEKNIHLVTLLDSEYPELLRHIYAPPLTLFYRGDLTLLSTQVLGIVGSRKATSYGFKVCESLIPELVKNNIKIVSGLARGIDTKAHRETISNGGSTIAVIGTGIDRYYPKENKGIQNYIGKNYLLLSEYAPGVGPQKEHFPYRNRIISGISRGVLVVEGQKRSGSLITARQALEEGRDVFTVPGSIFNSYSVGCNELIKMGAIPVLKPADILEEWNSFNY